MTLRKLKLLVPVPSDSVNLDIISESLLNYGALSVSFQDADRGTPGEQPIFREPPPGAVVYDPSKVEGQAPFWNLVEVSCLFSAQTDIESVVLAIGSEMSLPMEPRFKVEDMSDEDWVQKVQSTFKPIPFNRVVITFPWCAESTTAKRIPVVLEPGSAFGTGEHTTTRLCIQWLEENVLGAREETLLDYGSGSGILSIVARKLGMSKAVGIEIDPDANAVARKNIARNGLDDGSVQFFLPGSEPGGEQFPLVVANILALPLCSLAPTIASKTKLGGKLALSGILCDQAQMVVDEYARAGFVMTQAQNQDGWVLVTGEKTGNGATE